ncbi:hypothetical protein [Bacteroides stercoris]|jgi:hypothetical protein|uniref:Uncharacterized protein n=1 Tax=Bacteroides stercoris TaxID=46506 RepID=A0A413B4K8_BACSE|nr:hypothetical protein [Bacteroides stercoris]RGW32813.1 hypothetical protein DWV77_13015 [Bacteroides stercoris]
METLTIEQLGVKLYEAMNPALWSNTPREWQNKIVSAIQAIAENEKEINPDNIYWLSELYTMFGQIEKSGVASTNKLPSSWDVNKRGTNV